jgi:hypothetical protein
MKKLALIFSVFILSSCTKVIDLELKTGDAKLVVESLISDRIEPFKAKLTLLAPYFSTGNPAVTNAEVFIIDDLGNTDTLFHVANGIYETSTNRQGQQGRMYQMKINYGGQTYNAYSQLPQSKMLLDSITIIYNEGSAFIEQGYNVIIHGQDNGSTVDFYRFSFWKNGIVQTSPFKYFVVDDIPVQGNYVSVQVPYNYQPGDTARAEIQCIDEGYFKYLYALATQLQATGGPFDAPPSNPTTNISNGGLGYFAAMSRDTKEIIIP